MVYIFDQEYINRYRNNEEIKNHLEKLHLKLINREEIKNFIRWTPFKNGSTFTKQTKAQNTFKNKSYEYFLYLLTEIVCQSKIDIKYGRKSLQKSLSNFINYDALFLVKADYDENIEDKILEKYNENDEESIARYKTSMIQGFIVVEKGKCKNMPDSYSVKLICTIPGVKASPLLGAYLYMLKIVPGISKVGLLELSDAYSNLAGFCAYTKFGFQADLSFFDDTCFVDKNNLPMSVNVNSALCFTKKKIINAVVKNDPVCPLFRDDQELCTTYAPNKNRDVDRKTQKKLSKLYNQLYQQLLTRKKSTKLSNQTARYKIEINKIKNQIKNRKSISKK